MSDWLGDTFGADRWCAEFLAPWNDHDIDTAVSFFSDDAVWEFTAGAEPWGETHVGQHAIGKAFSALCDAVPDLHYDLVRQHAGPGHLVMEVLVTGTTREGQRLNYHACDIVHLSSGKVTAKRSYRKVVS